MAESYCGKNCAQCEQKEMLGCPGCTAGPGSLIGTECQLARCCISKGQTECAACVYSEDCNTLQERDCFLQHRLQIAETERVRHDALVKRAPLLGKWLWIIFWLIIPSTIGSVLSNDTIFGSELAFFVPGQVLRTVCALAYGLILLRLSSIEARYRIAAVCVLVGTLISTLTNFIFSGSEIPVWAVAISIATTVLSYLGEYSEFMAHNVVLTGLDGGLAMKWKTLWTWYIGSFGAFIGGTVLMMIIPDLGVMLTTAGSIGMAVTRVLKLVYLFRTAKCFRNYQPRHTAV